MATVSAEAYMGSVFTAFVLFSHSLMHFFAP